MVFALEKLRVLSKKLCGELLHSMILEYIDQYKKNSIWGYSKKTKMIFIKKVYWCLSAC